MGWASQCSAEAEHCCGTLHYVHYFACTLNDRQVLRRYSRMIAPFIASCEHKKRDMFVTSTVLIARRIGARGRSFCIRQQHPLQVFISNLMKFLL